MQLEKAAVQFASAYRGMKTSLYFTGTEHKALREKFSLENGNYNEIITHIHDYVRGNLRTPRIFDSLADGIELLRELISMRAKVQRWIILIEIFIFKICNIQCIYIPCLLQNMEE